MNNKIIIGISIILIGGAFYGGMLYGKSTAAATATNNRRNFQGMGGNFQGGAGGRNGGGGGNVNGEILSISDKIITVKMRDGGSKNVIYSASTPIRMFTEVKPEELKVGKTVTVNGTANSDGSVTAQIIQIRDASSTPFGPGGQGRMQQP